MKLYDSIGPNPHVVRMFLAELGIEIEKVEVDLMGGENRQEQHLNRNPSGQMPTLELDDGSFLAEITAICEYLDELIPENSPHNTFIKHVSDRPGHDFRYSINTDKIKKSIGWQPKTDFKEGLKKTINWYLDNKNWCEKIQKISGYYGDRIGKKRFN